MLRAGYIGLGIMGKSIARNLLKAWLSFGCPQPIASCCG